VIDISSSKEEVEEHLKKSHSDPQRDLQREDLWEYNDPPSFNAFMKVLRKTRVKPAQGPYGVSYIVYKRCPKVARQLWLYLKGMWKK